MPALALLLPGDPDTRTGGYLYDRRVARGLETLGWAVQVHRLHDSFPLPDEAALAHAAAVLAGLPDDRIALCDGLAFGALPRAALAERERLRLVALVHHPLALESGLAPASARALADSEREALTAARQVVATSASTARLLCEHYGVAVGRLAVVEPGTDPAPWSAGSGAGQETCLLCVGTLTPRKGHDLLVDALARVRDLRWRLICAGSTDRAPDWVRALRERIDAAGLAGRISLRGEIDAASLAACYHAADAFVLPTRLEGYGMALAEAVAHGLPVVTTSGGAAAQTVGDAALRVPADDVAALAHALRRLLTEPGLRAALAAAARGRAASLPTWEQAAQRMDRVLRPLAAP